MPLLQIRGINAAPSILSVLLQMPARKKHTGVPPTQKVLKVNPAFVSLRNHGRQLEFRYSGTA